MKIKNIVFINIIIVLLLITSEFVLTFAFWIKDVKELTISSSVKDAPYLYYIQDFEESLSQKKSSDKYRVAVIGGSVANQLGWYNFLDSMLNSKLNTKCIEVLNFGVDSYVLEQEFILTQLLVQKYQPNIIFGLDGFNDVYSFKFNRKNSDLILLPPQNYRDFMVIQDGKSETRFLHRFRGLFKSIFRTIDFIKRIASKSSYYDYSSITKEEIDIYGNYYIDIIEDIKDFCYVKGIKYYSFLQPVRFYNQKSNKLITNNIELEKLSGLLINFEDKIKMKKYCHSLVNLFHNYPEVYRDNCHVNKKGNKIISEKISDILVPIIIDDTVFTKIKSIK